MKKLLFAVICIFALLIGAYPLIYVFVEHKYTFLGSKSPEILHNLIWRIAFFAHIIFGGISLFIGWRQFGSKFRNKYIRIHRSIGRLYVVSVLISSVSAIYMGFYANGGIVSCVGFILLGAIWLITTSVAVVQISMGNVVKHQQFMIYSYACTFAAVTLRIWLPVLKSITHDPDNSYIIVAWLCWIPNVLVAYFINKKNPTTH
ncbi:DUF2306 domain-containing protein [Chryseobacterium joostei]|uniref:DUF2306 domain-containing protein n=1 Tax=Chryseobacterium joostei TaxID=112234 RepID=A0A1N7I9M5_9FLAO|nr:DUF2306 domain-containing protein [Chryseobacterium joostei]AZB01055.1 DUF2306 domain-containing protein [Chryseobacterium joostei]SIS33774.1 Predicted membrane protein [Chryseobacterium joostei]